MDLWMDLKPYQKIPTTKPIINSIGANITLIIRHTTGRMTMRIRERNIRKIPTGLRN